MRKIAKKTYFYRCGICGTDFPSKSEAESCEAGSVENRRFTEGSAVRAVDLRHCSCGRDYVCRGTVVRVIGPIAYSAEEHGKGFGFWSAHGHVYLYEVASRCPSCKEEKLVRYPAISLRRRPPRREAA
jgi:hypothetical protein